MLYHCPHKSVLRNVSFRQNFSSMDRRLIDFLCLIHFDTVTKILDMDTRFLLNENKSLCNLFASLQLILWHAVDLITKGVHMDYRKALLKI